MIPKIIHYCWFGKKEKPKKVIKLINSWKKKLSDYEFIEWNESNFNVNDFKFTKLAYEAKKYAFVADYVRLYALFNSGGIYLDTDVEVLKNFNNFLDLKSFISFESSNSLSTAVIGAEKGSLFIKECLEIYNQKNKDTNFQNLDLTPNSRILFDLLFSDKMDPNKIFELNYVSVYPIEYFCGKDFKTYKLIKTTNTICIHHLDSTRYSPYRKMLKLIKKILISFGFGFLWKKKEKE